MRLNPLTRKSILRKPDWRTPISFYVASRLPLSWAIKSLARQNNNVLALRFAFVGYAMLGRIADAHLMLARLREAGVPCTISHYRKWTAMQQQEDIELYVEACRIAGMPE